MEVLVCVYYRVDNAVLARVDAAVREFQRGLRERLPGLHAESFVRLVTSSLSNADAAAEATLMETYRVVLPGLAGDPAADAWLRRFLSDLETLATGGLAGLLRGERHVELFVPCVS